MCSLLSDQNSLSAIPDCCRAVRNEQRRDYCESYRVIWHLPDCAALCLSDGSYHTAPRKVKNKISSMSEAKNKRFVRAASTQRIVMPVHFDLQSSRPVGVISRSVRGRGRRSIAGLLRSLPKPSGNHQGESYGNDQDHAISCGCAEIEVSQLGGDSD